MAVAAANTSGAIAIPYGVEQDRRNLSFDPKAVQVHTYSAIPQAGQRQRRGLGCLSLKALS